MLRVTRTLLLRDLVKDLGPGRGQQTAEGTSTDGSPLATAAAGPTPPCEPTADGAAGDNVRYAVVGQERGGGLCVAVTNFTRRTCTVYFREKALDSTASWTEVIELSPAPRNRSRGGDDFLMDPPPCGEVVSAALSLDRHILVYTLRTPFDATASFGQFRYTTVLVQLPTMVWYSLTEVTDFPQRVQSMRLLPAGTRDAREYTATFLVTVFSQAIYSFSIVSTVKHRNQAFKQPKKDNIFVGPFVWSWYSVSDEKLYIIFKATKDKTASLQTLRVISVENPKKRELCSDNHFTTCVLISRALNEFQGSWPLPYVIPTHTTTASSVSSSSTPVPFTTTPTIAPVSPSLSPSSSLVPAAPSLIQPITAAAAGPAVSPPLAPMVASPLPNVRILNRENGLFMCVQRNLAIREGEVVKAIPITIIAFGLGIRVDYDIPIAGLDNEALSRVRVLFDVVAGSLLVYIPGFFVHLLDLQDHHNPIPGVFLSHASATPIPHTAPDPESGVYPPASIASFELLDGARHRFLDAASGAVYEYKIDNDHILRLVDTVERQDALLQLVHFVVVHMHKSELTTGMLSRICARRPEMATVPLLKEFAVGMTYQALTLLVPRMILAGLPSTTTDQQEIVLEKPAPVAHFRVLSVVSGAASAYTLKRYWRVVETPSAKFLQNHPDTRADDNDVLNYFVSIFGGTSNTDVRKSPATAPARRQAGDAPPVDEVTLRVLSRAFMLLHPKESPQFVHTNVSRLLDEQNSQLQQMFTTIEQSYFNDQRQADGRRVALQRTYFHIMEHLLVVSSELGGSLRHEFYDTFHGLGYSCLPRIVFREYVDRGIIIVTEKLIYMLLFKGVQNSDPEFFHFMLSRLPDDRVWQVLLSARKQIPLFVLQHFAARNSWLFGCTSKPGFAQCEGSPMIPLTLLVNAVSPTPQDLQHNASILVPSEPHAFAEYLKLFKDFDLFYPSIRFPRSDTPPG